ncbi:Cytochrome c [Thalassovita gelatinovora]|uniref:Cytochrome c n=1 Tax=Thalassovita gelatinovora TaxID=53501 RepID=A0A0P1FDZ3_THAGE|nr:sulfur oxidation c-type cytochrome SoxX [Thalassovita gelatinovora]QIZ79927.1 sulfur oxidation c-type cytochrome SoxX [Thalassovita gelatinovora]CUH66441.1 Cytochrome c [Thalassovita gelatinovora]SER13980.1 sulfur-oxidizing protein SoxX [Thalassovita gelatinovora]
MRLLTLTLAATLAAGAAFANPVSYADVVFNEDGGVEASLTGVAGNPEEGANIMKAKSIGNCVACHEITALADAPFHGNVGPILDGVADRWDATQLRGILVNAKMTYEGTVMPAYFKVDGYTRPGNAYTGKAAEGPLDPLLSAQQIEDVVAFLGTLKE